MKSNNMFTKVGILPPKCVREYCFDYAFFTRPNSCEFIHHYTKCTKMQERMWSYFKNLWEAFFFIFYSPLANDKQYFTRLIHTLIIRCNKHVVFFIELRLNTPKSVICFNNTVLIALWNIILSSLALYIYYYWGVDNNNNIVDS